MKFDLLVSCNDVMIRHQDSSLIKGHKGDMAYDIMCSPGKHRAGFFSETAIGMTIRMVKTRESDGVMMSTRS